MSNLRIVSENWILPDLLADSEASSERSGFAKENAFNGERRSKVWRSNGHWSVVSGENDIVFRETTLGPDLTATVTAGDYSSSTTFFAAVKSALELAGDSTYTVSADTTTGKVKIVSNGSGGGGVLILKWTVSTEMADLLGYSSATDDSGSLTYLADILKVHSDERLVWDLGLPGNPRAFIAVGPRNAPLKLSPSAVIKIQGSTTNVWDTPEFEATIGYDSRALTYFDEEGFHVEPLRFWSFEITDPSNPYGYVEIGYVVLGDYVTTDRGCAGFPFRVKKADRSVTVTSDGGYTSSDVRQKFDQFGLDWNGLTTADKELIEGVFDEYGTSHSLFFAFDPLEAFSTESVIHVRLCKFDAEPDFQLVSPGVWTMTMSLREEL